MALRVELSDAASEAVSNARELVAELVAAGVPAPPFGMGDDSVASELVIAGADSLFALIRESIARMVAREGVTTEQLEAMAAGECATPRCPVHEAIRARLEELRKAGA